MLKYIILSYNLIKGVLSKYVKMKQGIDFKSIIKNFLFCLILVMLYSCKKNESNNTNTTPSTPPPVTEPVPFAKLMTIYELTDSSSVLIKDSIVHCYFGSLAQVFNADTLWLNDSLIPYSGFYRDTNRVRISGTLKWKCSGTSTVAAFAHTYTSTYPSYSGQTFLPDTISKSSKVTFTVNGILNSSSEYSVVISPSSNGGLMKTSPILTDTVSFYPNQIMFLVASNICWVTVQLRNYKYEVINGKDFLFQNTLYYRKKIYLKP